jgi:hypothetical protein
VTTEWEMWVAIATGALATFTAILAWFTRRLGAETKSAVDEARNSLAEAVESDKHRRSEVQFLDADPLGAVLGRSGGSNTYAGRDGSPVVVLTVTNVGDRLVLGITATLNAEPNPSPSLSRSVLVPGETHQFHFPLKSFLTYEDADKRTNMQLVNDRCSIEIRSYGVMGQKVIQDFVLYLDHVLLHSELDPKFEQVRCYVEATTGESTEVRIG